MLEVGPGLGSLTLGLLEEGHPVTAVEIDPVLARALPGTVETRLPGAPLVVVTADALQLAAGFETATPSPPQPAATALVANLPYNVAVPVLLHLLVQFESLRTALVLVQSEVADRLAAPPGSKVYGVPSAKAAWFGEVTRAGAVGPNVFWPVPNVDSGLVRLVRRDPPVTTASRKEVFAVIDAAFSQRRKMLRSALASWAGSTAEAERIVVAAGVAPTARGETLDVKQFAAIAAARRSGFAIADFVGSSTTEGG